MSTISGADLLLYLDNDVHSDVRQAIEADPTLINQTDELKQIQEQLCIKLTESLCPDHDMLGEYHLRILPLMEHIRVRYHIRQCLSCFYRLNQLAQFIDSPDGYIDDSKPHESNMSFVYPHPALFFAAASGDMRGAMDAKTVQEQATSQQTHLRYTVQRDHYEGEISLQIQTPLRQSGHKNIVGLMTGNLRELFEAVELRQVHHAQTDKSQTIAKLEVNKLGGFIFRHIPDGEYELLVHSIDFPIGLRDIQV